MSAACFVVRLLSLSFRQESQVRGKQHIHQLSRCALSGTCSPLIGRHQARCLQSLQVALASPPRFYCFSGPGAETQLRPGVISGEVAFICPQLSTAQPVWSASASVSLLHLPRNSPSASLSCLSGMEEVSLRKGQAHQVLSGGGSPAWADGNGVPTC